MNPTKCSFRPLLALLAASTALAQEARHPVLAIAEDGSFGAVNGAAVVRFEDAGARIRPHAGGDVQLRLFAIRRGAHEVRGVAARPERATGRRVEYRRGGVVERYELTARGFEQSFVLEQRPAGTGDLVLQVAVLGASPTAARAAEHAPIDLVGPTGPAVRYGAAFAFERGGERVPLATSWDGRGVIELIVPGALLDRASYPLVVDPVVEPVFVVAPAAAGQTRAASDVARNDLHDTYMAVWVQSDASGDRVYLRAFWADGTPRTGPMLVSNLLVDCARPTISDVAGYFAIAWESADRIFGKVVGASGGTITFSETFTDPGIGGRDQRASIAGNEGGSFILGWDHTPPGASAPVEIRVQHVRIPTGTSLVFGPVRTLASVPSGGHVEDMALPRSAVRHSVTGNSDWLEARAVWSRWYTSPAPGDFDLHTASFRIRGAAIGGNFLVLDGPASVVGAAAIGPSEAHGDIAVMADASLDPTDVLYCAVWDVGGDVRGQRFDPTAAIGATIDVEVGTEVTALPSIGAGACEFSVAYGYETMAGVSQVRAARLLRDGTVAAADVAVDGTSGGASFAAPRVSSRPVRNSTTDSTNRCMITYDRAPTAAPAASDVRVAVWEPVGYSLSPFGAACAGPLGELPTIGTAGNAYAGTTDFEITLTNAPTWTIAALLISDVFVTVPVPGAPGCSAYLGLPVLSALPSSTSAGSTSRTISLPCGIPSGFAVAMQWIVYTPGHNAFGWITSDDIDVYWSHF